MGLNDLDDEPEQFQASKSRWLLLDEHSYKSPHTDKRNRRLVLILAVLFFVTIPAAVFFASSFLSPLSRAHQEVTHPHTDIESHLVKPDETKGKPLVLYLDPSHNYTHRSPCGRSPEEARAAGCHFELFSFSWVPEQCRDDELARKFIAVGEWEFWLDADGQKPISQAEAEMGHYESLYTTWNYHLQHCTAMWQKMHRAVI